VGARPRRGQPGSGVACREAPSAPPGGPGTDGLRPIGLLAPDRKERLRNAAMLSPEILKKLDAIEARFDELTLQLSDPAVVSSGER
jgi:hypothetical protein